MSNPVILLAVLLERWQLKPGTTSFTTRYAEHDPVYQSFEDPVDFWRAQARAVQLMTQVDELLDEAVQIDPDVAHLRESRLAWYEAVFSARWGRNVKEGAARDIIDRADLHSLRSLAVIVRQLGLVPEVPTDDLSKIAAALDELEVLVRESAVVDAQTKSTMLSVLTTFRRCIESCDAFGVVAFREAAQRVL